MSAIAKFQAWSNANSLTPAQLIEIRRYLESQIRLDGLNAGPAPHSVALNKGLNAGPAPTASKACTACGRPF